MANIQVPTEPVNSSNIKAIGYDPTFYILQVDFWNGAKYQYKPVHPDTLKELKAASSMGQYFNLNIKVNSNYTVTKIQDKYDTSPGGKLSKKPKLR